MTQRQYEANLRSPHLPKYATLFDSPLDRWISYAVKVLRDGSIETYESCQGGPGHSFPEPTVRFHGTAADGFRAFALAYTFGLPVLHLRRFWTAVDGELTGPSWEMTFYRARLQRLQEQAKKSGLIV